MSIFTQRTNQPRIVNKCNHHNNHNNNKWQITISHNDVPKYIEDDIKNGRVKYVNFLRQTNFKIPSFQIYATKWIRACLDNFMKNPPIYHHYILQLTKSLINSIGIDKTIHGLTKPWMSYNNIDNEWSFLHMICSKNLLQTFKAILPLLKNHHPKLILSTPIYCSSSKCKISPLYCCIANGHKYFTAYLFNYYGKNLKSADIASILQNGTPNDSSNSLVMHLINYNHQQTLQQLLNEDRKRLPQTFLTQSQVQVISIQINSPSPNGIFRKIATPINYNNTSIRPSVQTTHTQRMAMQQTSPLQTSLPQLPPHQPPPHQLAAFKTHIKCVHSGLTPNCSCIKDMALILQEYNDYIGNDCKDIYRLMMNNQKQLLDKFIHIIDEHYEQISEIYEILEEFNMVGCDVMECQAITRYYRDRRNDDNGEQTHHDMFVRDLFDQIHVYFYHLYDLGLRVRRWEDDDAEYGSTDAEDSEDDFDNLCDKIEKKQEMIKEMDHSRYHDTDRFSLKSQPNEKQRLLMDVLFGHLIEYKQGKQLKQQLIDEEFDTDAVLDDMTERKDENGSESNIVSFISNINSIPLAEVQRYVNAHKLSENTFDGGFRFHYVNRQYSQNGHSMDNINGHLSPEIYIVAKYKSLKDEILNNTICTLTQGQFDFTMHKIKQYMQSDKIRSIRCWVGRIAKNAPIPTIHLLALLLYCDWNHISDAFCNTFRKLNRFESISDLKARHSEYGNWAKYLREAIESYGSCQWINEWALAQNMSMGNANGPFYVQSRNPMVIPQLSMTINCPLSTTKTMEVAVKFAKQNGSIITLNYHRLRFFNLRWFSNHKAEDERVFCGNGDWRFLIDNVVHIGERINYQHERDALFYFDAMLGGTDMDQDEERIFSTSAKETDVKLWEKLIKNESEESKYIIDTFDAFKYSKTDLNLNLSYIDNSKYKDIIHLFFDNLKSDQNPHGSTKNNTLRKEIFDIFPNVKNIYIHTSNWMLSYIIDIDKLYEMVKEISLTQHRDINVIISASHRYDFTMNADKKSKSNIAELMSKYLFWSIIYMEYGCNTAEYYKSRVLDMLKKKGTSSRPMYRSCSWITMKYSQNNIPYGVQLYPNEIILSKQSPSTATIQVDMLKMKFLAT